MPEHDPAVLSYSHLSDFPRADSALHTLKKVASMVKPIMRARGWKVKQLVEFYPEQQNLLGLNINKGQKVCLRLRYPGDRDQFMPFESVVDTMLHELCHIVHGPHDDKFHALWDQLRQEQEGLIMKGYSGEGFLSQGQRLGGSSVSPLEARRLARQQAEKRRAQAQGTGSGRRLGGSGVVPARNMRQVIAAAAERRKRTMEGCGTQRLTEKEIYDIGNTATKNGFRTQAEEDEANEVAIAQALWELVQEDEAKNKAGPSSNQPAPSPLAAKQAPTAEADKEPDQRQNKTWGGGWVCNICTLFNQPEFLCCDACGTKRSTDNNSNAASGPSTPREKRARSPEIIDLTEESPQPKPSAASGSGKRAVPVRQQKPPEPSVSQFWMCGYCGQVMERQWWTCSSCGQMKESSK
ncbi:unnamed protein product [Clonostachys rosea]|uniref:WLM domain-containing protein n=1 Tax=Bionectria ochroleuca TaxID=29856 RepID=A0ABY6TQM5_BIOOC|nr:unnamed protein product [Clonostachys rosea]